MYNTELLKELDNSILNLTYEQYQELNDSSDCISMLKKTCHIISVSEDINKINFFNKIILIYLSSLKKDYSNCATFIQKADISIWNYILVNFDDDSIHSLIVILYLCILNVPIQTEFIIKVFKILFANRRMCDFLTETEVFFNENNNLYTFIFTCCKYC